MSYVDLVFFTSQKIVQPFVDFKGPYLRALLVDCTNYRGVPFHTEPFYLLTTPSPTVTTLVAEHWKTFNFLLQRPQPDSNDGPFIVQPKYVA
jgi:hypothetical protein